MLPTPIPLGQASGHTLVVNTALELKVSDVTSSTNDGIYRCGDAISIQVTFSYPVQVTGVPYLWLELGAVDRQATYVSGDGSTVLSFLYTIESGDYTNDLAYLDRNSLVLPEGTAIKQL